LSAKSSTATASPRLALFDLDGTLLAGDTDELWCAFLIEEGILERATFEAANRDIAERYARGAITPAEFCAFYAATLAGRSAAEWLPLRQRFVAAVIAPRLGAAALALVEQHRAAGDRLVLTTATNRFLTEPISDRLGIADLIATELELSADRFTGRNAGVLNMREGKLTRLNGWLADQGLGDADSLARATFYSDSINDLALLCAVARPVVVDPDSRLEAEAAQRSWPVLRLAPGSLRSA
jgi:HAD superfamily hydrolase (TIGR01490 family)